MALNRPNLYGYLGTHRNGDSQASLQFTDSWMDKMAVGNDIRRHPNLNPFTFLGPLATAMPSTGRTRTGSTYGSAWERSNRIYGQIFDVSPRAASQALALSSAHYADMIFKAVVKGWSALNSEERNNPIMRTLGDMDQVFSALDPVSRAAFMYKSHMLLKASFEAYIYTHIRKLTKFSIIWIPTNIAWMKFQSGRDRCKTLRLRYDVTYTNCMKTFTAH